MVALVTFWWSSEADLNRASVFLMLAVAALALAGSMKVGWRSSVWKFNTACILLVSGIAAGLGDLVSAAIYLKDGEPPSWRIMWIGVGIAALCAVGIMSDYFCPKCRRLATKRRSDRVQLGRHFITKAINTTSFTSASGGRFNSTIQTTQITTYRDYNSCSVCHEKWTHDWTRESAI